MDLKQQPHRRYNPLLDEWVLVSPHRTQRPWQGQTEAPTLDKLPAYDPACYLCPGNTRAGGNRNPGYAETFVFTNDFAALLPDTAPERFDVEGLLRAEAESGSCRVIVFSPRHDLTLARMDVEGIVKAVDAWAYEYRALAANPEIGYVQIFENRGAMMGCSNPHPHCQIWATRTLPDLPAREQRHFEDHAKKKGSCLLCDILTLESRLGERIVYRNESFAALVPFWAVWPFELLVIPTFHGGSIEGLTPAQTRDLASCLRAIGIKYDNVFQSSFPYSMGIHQKPTDGKPHDEWHFHLHYFPPLLRSATVRKFMVGFELMAMPQRDITPELAAEKLRSSSDTHFMEGGA